MAKRVRQDAKIYIGPTLPRYNLIQNTVYENVKSVDTIKEKCPLIGNLFITLDKYPDAEKQISERTGIYWSAFKDALKL